MQQPLDYESVRPPSRPYRKGASLACGVCSCVLAILGALSGAITKYLVEQHSGNFIVGTFLGLIIMIAQGLALILGLTGLILGRLERYSVWGLSVVGLLLTAACGIWLFMKGIYL
jgi:hypothetical protein